MRSLHPLSRTLFVSEKPRVQGSSRNLERTLREAFFASGDVRSLHPLSRTLFVSEKPRVQGSSRNLGRPLREAFIQCLHGFTALPAVAKALYERSRNQCQNLIFPPSRYWITHLLFTSNPQSGFRGIFSRWMNPPAEAGSVYLRLKVLSVYLTGFHLCISVFICG